MACPLAVLFKVPSSPPESSTGDYLHEGGEKEVYPDEESNLLIPSNVESDKSAIPFGKTASLYDPGEPLIPS